MTISSNGWRKRWGGGFALSSDVRRDRLFCCRARGCRSDALSMPQRFVADSLAGTHAAECDSGFPGCGGKKEEQGRLSTFSQQVITDLKQEVRQRMGRLTGDLLTGLRCTEGIELRRESFDLQELLQRAQRTLQPQAEAQQVALCMTPGESLPVLADPDRVSGCWWFIG